MARIEVVTEGVDVEGATLIEGLPGVGLVGKIAADHLVNEFEMTHYANVYCDAIPKAAAYGEGDAELRTPVRLYADSERGLAVLQSDVPVSPAGADEFADCIVGWYDDHDVTPVYLSGLPHEKDDEVPDIYGIATGGGRDLLADAGIDEPSEMGLITGPTGALLHHALEHERRAVGLVVQSDPRFPDPEAARVLITHGIEPLTNTEVPVDDLVERAEEIREAKERLAKRMQEAQEESTQAQPLRMYQ